MDHYIQNIILSNFIQYFMTRYSPLPQTIKIITTKLIRMSFYLQMTHVRY